MGRLYMLPVVTKHAHPALRAICLVGLNAAEEYYPRFVAERDTFSGPVSGQFSVVALVNRGARMAIGFKHALPVTRSRQPSRYQRQVHSCH